MNKIQEAWLRLAACITAQSAEEFSAAYPKRPTGAGRQQSGAWVFNEINKELTKGERKWQILTQLQSSGD